jgi:molecular chaperone GrpE
VSRADDENEAQAAERVVIRDRRKINPNGKVSVSEDQKAKDTSGGAHRAAEPNEVDPAPAGEAAPAPAVKPGLGAELEALRGELEERTRDLQRVTAEYANYRKRVDRDRGAAAEQTTGAVLSALLPVLDDVDRAREHGDLVGPFATVAEALTAATGKFGLAAFGEKGEKFDPTRHEAVAHLTSAEVTEPTCVDVMRRGYTLGERLLRPALVAVADPE